MIRSVLDQDLYTFTVGQAVLENYPEAVVSSRFNNRKGTTFNDDFFALFRNEVERMAGLKLLSQERKFLEGSCKYLKSQYLDYVQDYRFNPDEVKINRVNDSLEMDIVGTWHQTIFWEVPLLALVSECYYRTVDKNWNFDGQQSLIIDKGNALSAAGCTYSDFGTRRRRSFESQENVVRNLKGKAGFNGTSNVLLAYMHDVKPIGTMSHQWFMGVSALESLRHANRYGLQRWHDTYHGDLGIALPDTFGTAPFFEDFDKNLSNLYDGVRHDSDCPFKFTDKVVNHYRSHGIDPMTKIIVFSDGLTVTLAIELQKYCDLKGIRCAFGIGTHFSNDYADSPALNIVIKLRSVWSKVGGQEIQVVKLSDVLTKATGDADALKVALWTFYNQSLNS